MSEENKTANRRQFIKNVLLFATVVPLLGATNSFCRAQTRQSQQTPQKIVGGGCDGCESIYEGMPERLSWETKIASDSEPGEPMEISGAIYKADGKTPAPNVILYVYHTDAQGYYTPTPNQTGRLARRNGHLRGWMKTNRKGEYKFTSIKPAPYPNRDIPAHIHPIVKEPDKNEYYFDDYWFDDDALLTKEKRTKLEKRGGSGIIHLTKINGVWSGTRNIILGLNIPDYK